MADDSDWQRKGATLGHKAACKEYGLTEAEIVDAIRAGKLQYRQGSMHGNPWLRLLRREVEALVEEMDGAAGLDRRRLKGELKRVDREVRRLKKQVKDLEKERARLAKLLGE